MIVIITGCLPTPFTIDREAEYKRIDDIGSFTLSIDFPYKHSAKFDYTHKALIKFPDTIEGIEEKLYSLSDHLVQPELTIEMTAKKFIKLPKFKEIDEEERYYNSRIKEYDAFIEGAKSKAARIYWSNILKSHDLKER